MKAIINQIDFLLKEARQGNISLKELMQLIDIVYKDYLDFHPEELENIKGSLWQKKSNS
jgi:hypothetical protein